MYYQDVTLYLFTGFGKAAFFKFLLMHSDFIVGQQLLPGDLSECKCVKNGQLCGPGCECKGYLNKQHTPQGELSSQWTMVTLWYCLQKYIPVKCERQIARATAVIFRILFSIIATQTINVSLVK